MIGTGSLLSWRLKLTLQLCNRNTQGLTFRANLQRGLPCVAGVACAACLTMSYYTRILTPSADVIGFDDLEALLKSTYRVRLQLELGTVDEWEQVLVMWPDGRPAFQVERNPVKEGSLAEEELGEFAEWLASPEALPKKGAEWVAQYLKKVKCIYASQLMDFKNPKVFEVQELFLATLHDNLGGIFQADHEGFTNEAGYHVVWDFADDAKGPLRVALQMGNGWVPFEIELSNPQHRREFLKGRIPPSAIPI